jgi:hypothetical protein
MLYWFCVYAFVVIVVFLPFLVLYMVVAAAWLGLAAVRFMIRRLKNDSAIRTGFSREHWSMINRLLRSPFRFTRAVVGTVEFEDPKRNRLLRYLRPSMGSRSVPTKSRTL